MLAALLGGETLTELRQSLTIAESEVTGGAAPRVAPFADVRALGGLLQRAGFALPVVDIDRVVVRYADLLGPDARSARVRRDQRADRAQPRRRCAARFSRAPQAVYAERFADPDGRLRATFETLWVSGWAPHAEPAEAAEARLGGDAAGGRAEGGKGGGRGPRLGLIAPRPEEPRTRGRLEGRELSHPSRPRSRGAPQDEGRGDT